MFTTLGAASVALLLLSLMLGSVQLAPAAVWDAFWSTDPSMARDVVLGLRLPRALTAFAVGGLLGLAGALLQVLLRNPLADPYVLGVSGGASVTALLALMAGLSAVMIDAAAAVGALAACALVFALAQGRGGWTPTRLLLTGVVVAAGAGSIVSLLLAMSDDTRLRGMVFWLLGDLSRSDRWGWLLALLAVATVFCVALGPPPQRAGARRDYRRHGRARRAARAQHRVRLELGADWLRREHRGQHRLRGSRHAAPGAACLGNDQRTVLAGSALLGGLVLMTADLHHAFCSLRASCRWAH